MALFVSRRLDVLVKYSVPLTSFEATEPPKLNRTVAHVNLYCLTHREQDMLNSKVDSMDKTAELSSQRVAIEHVLRALDQGILIREVRQEKIHR